MQAETFKRRPQLADYNAAIMRPFAEEFAEDVRLNHPGAEHIPITTPFIKLESFLNGDMDEMISALILAGSTGDIDAAAEE